jgi:hypothetical protein
MSELACQKTAQRCELRCPSKGRKIFRFAKALWWLMIGFACWSACFEGVLTRILLATQIRDWSFPWSFSRTSELDNVLICRRFCDVWQLAFGRWPSLRDHYITLQSLTGVWCLSHPVVLRSAMYDNGLSGCSLTVGFMADHDLGELLLYNASCNNLTLAKELKTRNSEFTHLWTFPINCARFINSSFDLS